jgi:hypothetical protein
MYVHPWRKCYHGRDNYHGHVSSFGQVALGSPILATGFVPVPSTPECASVAFHIADNKYDNMRLSRYWLSGSSPTTPLPEDRVRPGTGGRGSAAPGSLY